MDKKNKKIFLLCIGYLLFLFGLKLVRYQTPIYKLNPNMNGINLVPFSTISEYFEYFDFYNPSIIIVGIFSLFIFVPPAIYLAVKEPVQGYPKGYVAVILIGLSLAYSIFSRVLGIGVFDIDTMILRFILSLGSYYLYKVIVSKGKKYERSI